MREKIAVIALVLVTVVSTVLGAEPVSVSAWTSPPLTPAEIGVLTAELHRFEEILSDETLGSQQRDKDSWDSHAFARYTGGVLAGLGYEVRLATNTRWPGGSHSWVLVNLASSLVDSAWVPIEAVPPSGSRQFSLGSVPTQSVSENGVMFDSRYVLPESTTALAPNQPPTARIRFLSTTLQLDTASAILALGSRDADGEIVIYRWRLGDDEWLASRSWSMTITPTIAGPTSLTLQVIDNQGASGTTSLPLTVKVPRSELPSDDCGCS
ncbi:PKD domain-containing protein [Candidatus Bipolaricaulota bacterium]